MNDANIRNLIAPQENQGFRCERTSDWGPASSATISLRINDVPLWEAENLQFPRRFAAGTETSETAKTAKIGL